MKILCIGRNYAEHIAELKNERPDEPVIFSKPDTAVLKHNADFYYPDFSQDVHHEVEILVRIGKEGKSIATEYAHKYINGVGLGIDFTARDIQSKLKEKRLSWELAKGFNGSAVISEFIEPDKLPQLNNLSFSLSKNGERVQQGNSSHMLFPVAELISFLSKYFTLKAGDIIFTGTPKGVGSVNVGDILKGELEGKEMFSCEVK